MIRALRSDTYTLLILFIGGVIYFTSFGKHVIMYQNDEFLFLYTPEYLKTFMNMPGGVSEWLTSFFTQFYYYPFLGALVISGLLLVTWILTRYLFAFIGLVSDMGLSLIVYGALFGIVQFFENSILPVVAVLIVLSFLFLVLRIKNNRVRYILEILSAIILYVLTGAYFAIFIALIVVSELLLFKGRFRFVSVVTIFSLGLYIPYFFSIHFYYLFAPVAYKYPVVTDTYFHGYPFAVIITVLVLIVILASSGGSRFASEKVYKYAGYSKVLILTGVIIYIAFIYNSPVAKLVGFAQTGKNAGIASSYSVRPSALWDGVLKQAAEYRGTSSLYPYYINMALEYKGQLLDDMMKYDQRRGVLGLYYPWVGNSHMREYGGLFYYTIGYVNEAHHWAYESMIHTGPVAPVLKELTVYNIVLGKIKGAEKYLNVLDQTIFYKKWAGRFLELLKDTTKLNDLVWVREKRKQIPDGDYFMDLAGLQRNLENMVSSNPGNKIAFDYLIAFYLLDGRPDKVLERYTVINKFYSSIPKTVKEALVLLPDYPSELSQQHLQLGRYIKARDNMMKTHSGELQFDKMYSETYWYYIDFVSPHHKLRK